MIPQTQIVGIDVAKDWLDVAVDARVERIDNTPVAIRALARRLARDGRTHVGLEPTGGYERLAVAAFRAVGLTALQVDSWRLRQFGKASGTRAKTDPIDARTIASYLASHEARPFAEPTRTQADLTAWSREIARAEADILRLRNHLSHVELAAIRRAIDAEIKALQTTLATAEAAIKAVLAEDETLARKAELLDSVPGIGPKTIRVLLAEMPELGHLDPRAAGALAGLAPYQRDSGKTRGRAHVEAGRRAIKRAAFLAARAVRLHNPWAASIHNRLRAAGKPDKVATIALAQRIVVVLNALVQTNTPWDPHRATKT